MTTTKRPPGDEERRRLIEDFEWLEDHCWVLPPEERAAMTAPPKRDNPKLSDEDRLREAINLGVKMAEADALFRLTMKARQVRAAEIEERRPRLVVDNTKRPKVIGGPCVTPILNGDVARVIERPGGGWRIEYWKKDLGWIEAPHGAFNLADFVPGDTNRPVLPKDAARLGCRLEDFGRHWTEEPGHPWDRAKIVDALKNRAWDLACRQCAPGNA
jgi:hypothetical protein